MNIITKNLSELRPVARNVRKHPQAQINELAKSYKMFGQYRPLVVTADGEILVGNGLYEALKVAGAETAEVIQLPDNISDAYKNKLMLADNRLYTMGADDVNNIDAILAEMQEFDIPGFDSATLEQLYTNIKTDEEVIKGMGNVPADKIEQIKKTEADRAENPLTERVKGKNESSYGSTVENATEGLNGASVGKYVNCPHCGAKIWL